MRKTLLATLSIFTLSFVVNAADEKTPTEKPATPATPAPSDLFQTRSNVGDVAGQVVSVDGSNIKIKVAQQQPATTTNRNPRSRTAPRMTVKYVEQSYALAEKAKVISNGKDVGVAGIQPGDYATLHITNLKSAKPDGKPGDKLESHIEINKVTITGHTQAPAPAKDAPKK